MKRTLTPVALAAAWALTMSGPAALAQSDPDSPPVADTAPYALFDGFEQATGIKLQGYLQAGYAVNNRSTHAQATGGHSNFPVVGPSDEGLQLNELHVVMSQAMRGNLLPRITPLPGPVPWDYSWGFNAELLYGRNGLPASMHGLDADWRVNQSPSGVAPGSNRQNYWATPQVYAEAYLPWWQGVAVMAGRFGAGVGYEIPPSFRPGPDFFYSRTYAFVAQPDQVAGVLASVNVLRSELGLVATEMGLVNGRQNWRDNNGDKSLIGAVRWRSSDMATWVDYSFMSGNEQSDPDVTPQMPTSRLISPRGQRRSHHSLSIVAHPMDRVEVHAEALMGEQKGDGQADTIDILTGPGFTGGRYRGLNAQVSWRARDTLQYAVRAETFQDRKGIALFPVTAVPGDFNALTLGARIDLTRNVLLRPELRYDWQSHNQGVKAFGGGSASNQTTLSADLVFYF
ncbi:outer membrane beta-barrel protein [Aquabacterium sp.]|uniref:outer membrane beta-barrel protein n=1 Tax=Aquabacterium sp. TaxID=1872578 RepID=UPI0025B80525|nr:outer membrane beta-barrel protein [Aquabacterium sp.]